MRLALVLCILALTPIALATHQSGWCEPTTASPEYDLNSNGVPIYIDFDWGDDAWSFWIYQESNGVVGLQRVDEYHDGTCGHPELGDTIVF